MSKERLYICHGPHRTAKRQAHKPKGWTIHPAKRQDGVEVEVWFCPECRPTSPPNGDGKDAL